MISPLSSQLFGLAVSVAAGFLLGAFYDVFRIWRTFLHTEKRAVFFQDVFYMVVAAIVTFLLALAISYGEIRYYLLLGEAVGWFVYYFTVGQVTGLFSRFVSRLLYRFIFYPLARLFRRLSKFFGGKFRFLGKIALKSARIAKKGLKRGLKVVYNHFVGMSKKQRLKKGLHDHESHQRAKTK